MSRFNRIFVLPLLLFCFVQVRAEMLSDTLQVYFRSASSDLDSLVSGNAQVVDRLKSILSEYESSGDVALVEVKVYGRVSPEGSYWFNYYLSRRRAVVMRDLLIEHLGVSVEKIKLDSRVWDYPLLRAAIDAVDGLPCRSRVVRLLEEADRYGLSEKQKVEYFNRGLDGINVPGFKRSLYRRLFPVLRASFGVFEFVFKKNERSNIVAQDDVSVLEKEVSEELVSEELVSEEPVSEEPVSEGDGLLVAPLVLEAKPCKPLYAALKTNLLLDALLVPNIGAEIFIGKNFSLSGNYMHSWWHSDRTHYYWRTYGGDLELRYWFGQVASRKPLTGHHVGVYGQAFTFDVELGGVGYLANEYNWVRGAGVTYGYSLPISRRFNLDFVLGLGYLQGKYDEYRPSKDCYLWLKTHRASWLGPTKIELSLVWLFGCDNYNRNKRR